MKKNDKTNDVVSRANLANWWWSGQTGDALGVSGMCVSVWRRKRGIPHVKLPGGIFLYNPAEVRVWAIRNLSPDDFKRTIWGGGGAASKRHKLTFKNGRKRLKAHRAKRVPWRREPIPLSLAA